MTLPIEDVDRAEDLRSDFLQAMRRLATTVTIVTKAHQGSGLGMTATAVCSLTSDPPAIMVCVNQSASICRWLVPGEAFCVNFLAERHADTAAQFGGKTPVEARFSHGNWSRSEEGTPFLLDGLCNLFCTVDLATTYGTHTMLVGRVTDVRLTENKDPLLYGSGAFRSLGGLVA